MRCASLRNSSAGEKFTGGFVDWAFLADRILFRVGVRSVIVGSLERWKLSWGRWTRICQQRQCCCAGPLPRPECVEQSNRVAIL